MDVSRPNGRIRIDADVVRRESIRDALALRLEENGRLCAEKGGVKRLALLCGQRLHAMYALLLLCLGNLRGKRGRRRASARRIGEYMHACEVHALDESKTFLE